ncbi:expressed protein [Phakopsora pachyrhizi]|uniref:Expressed protein n=1 Tax=Phakopsora pachyrhizi TaxID=170000 RepID=A0AAV0B1G8_PHAPC|nr:expressed protein [Phakopsora pachyrhizi]
MKSSSPQLIEALPQFFFIFLLYIYIFFFILLTIGSIFLFFNTDAVVKATDIYSSAVLWGPDFKGWQSSKTLTKNIKNQFGSESYFDAVLVYFNNNQVKFLKIDPIP